MIRIIDFGGSYAQLTARKIRELGYYCEILPHHSKLEDLMKDEPTGLIFAGATSLQKEVNPPKIDTAVYEQGLPILAIGYGMHLMANDFGGSTKTVDECKEQGVTAKLSQDSSLFKNLDVNSNVWMCKGCQVANVPEDFLITASSVSSAVVAMEDPARRLYGVQFHPEAEGTQKGKEILENFCKDILKIEKDWNMADFAKKKIEEIKETVGSDRVICALSGGVDSSVSALLVHKAIGKQLTCIFVDHGCMRKNEGNEVMENYGKVFDMDIRRIDAQDRFLGKLKGVTDPEQKRKIIGEEFIRVFEEEAGKLGDAKFLVQGTIYPDVVESVNVKDQVIKSHHNVGGLPEDITFQLIEPLRELFKDEVRALGEEIGLQHSFVWRQPFPGPGLAVRCIGELTKERLDILRDADAIFREEIIRHGLNEEIWQYFAILTNLRSTGVSDEKRTYSNTIALRAVYSIDAMTAQWARIPFEVLDVVSKRIVSEVSNVNRVVYDITSKPPATIEWE